jgi:hypothetical protein
MRPLFWLSILMAILAVSCTTSNHDVAQSNLVAKAEPVVRCAAAGEPPQSDPCSAKTMAGQRLRR